MIRNRSRRWSVGYAGLADGVHGFNVYELRNLLSEPSVRVELADGKVRCTQCRGARVAKLTLCAHANVVRTQLNAGRFSYVGFARKTGIPGIHSGSPRTSGVPNDQRPATESGTPGAASIHDGANL